MKRLMLGLAAAVLLAGTAWAAGPDTKYGDSSLGKVLTDANGMTLYTFDNDGKGAAKSSCEGKCIINWPPFVAADGAAADGDWTLVDVTDKDGKAVKMWAYEGWPLYYWINDKKAGDVDGDGKGGVWHVVKEH
jgi:predicted lipoprotein with Yx(FWY)xxD motif